MWVHKESLGHGPNNVSLSSATPSSGCWPESVPPVCHHRLDPRWFFCTVVGCLTQTESLVMHQKTMSRAQIRGRILCLIIYLFLERIDHYIASFAACPHSFRVSQNYLIGLLRTLPWGILWVESLREGQISKYGTEFPRISHILFLVIYEKCYLLSYR